MNRTTGNLFNLIERGRENGTNTDCKLSWRFTQVHVHVLHEEATHRFHVTRVIRYKEYLRNRVRFHALFVEPNDFFIYDPGRVRMTITDCTGRTMRENGYMCPTNPILG